MVESSVHYTISANLDGICEQFHKSEVVSSCEKRYISSSATGIHIRHVASRSPDTFHVAPNHTREREPLRAIDDVMSQGHSFATRSLEEEKLFCSRIYHQ